MNRYSQYTPSQFNPLSMEEIFTVPLAKQGRHDQAQAALDELGLFYIQRLQQDNDLAEGYINEYTDKINQEVDSINQSGINNQSLGRIKAMARDRQKWLTQGQGKDIKANYDAYVANKAQLDKQLEKKIIGADKYQLGLQQALDRYEGVAKGDKYDAFVGVEDTDYVAEALELAKAVPTQKQEQFLQENGYQLSPDGSTWVHGTTGREFTKPGAIADIVIHGLGNNANVMADLKQREELGIFGERTARDILGDLAITMEKDLGINSISLDPKLTSNKGYNKNNANPQNVVYNSRTNAPEVEVVKDKVLDKLAKIGTTITIPGSTGYMVNGVYQGSSSKATTKKIESINDLNLKPEEVTQLQSFATKLNENDLIKDRLGLENDDLKDPKTIEKVTQYINDFQNLEFTQNVVNANSSRGLLNSLPKTNSTLLNQTNEYIKTEIDAGGILLYDQKSGKKLNDSDISKFDEIKFTGYYSPDNLINHLEEANDATMTSPGEIIAYKDGKKVGQFYTSRPTSDMDSVEFQAASLIKNIKTDMVNNLGLQSSMQLPEAIIKSKGYKNINYMFDPDTSLYTVSMDKILPDGSIQTLTPQNVDGTIATKTASQLQDTIYRMYGITRNND